MNQNNQDIWLTNNQPDKGSYENNSDCLSSNCICNFCKGTERSHVSYLIRKLNRYGEKQKVTLMQLDRHIGNTKRLPGSTFTHTNSNYSQQVQELVRQLAANCRVVTSDRNESNDFSSRLEMNINGRWSTLLSYDCHHGLSFRYVYAPSGRVFPCQLDLPSNVIKQMSQEDFSRNWLQYCKDFSKQQY